MAILNNSRSYKPTYSCIVNQTGGNQENRNGLNFGRKTRHGVIKLVKRGGRNQTHRQIDAYTDRHTDRRTYRKGGRKREIKVMREKERQEKEDEKGKRKRKIERKR